MAERLATKAAWLSGLIGVTLLGAVIAGALPKLSGVRRMSMGTHERNPHGQQDTRSDSGSVNRVEVNVHDGFEVRHWAKLDLSDRDS